MPIYEVTAPDGQTYEVNAPEDATEQQVMAYAQSQFAQQAKSPVGDQHGAATRFAYGAQEPITGLAQMVYEAMPESVQEAGTDIDKWLYEKTGGIIGKAKPFSEAVRGQEAWYQSGAPEGFDAARMAGNVATGILATRGMGAPATAGQSAIQGGLIGGGLGAAAPVYGGDYWSEKGRQVGTGAGFGAALGPVGYGVSRMISPKAAISPEVSALREAGIQPTIGGTLGGAPARVEQMAQSIPLFGDAIAAARSATREQFNKAVLNQVVAPVGKTVKDTGNAAIAEIQKISKAAYKDAEKLIPGFRLDDVARNELRTLVSSAKNLKTNEAARFAKFMKNEFGTRFRDGGATSNAYKRLDSEIGKALKGNQNTELGGAFKELDEILKRQAERVSPEYRAALDTADEVFKKRLIVENAVNRASGSEGLFTPKQLLQSSKATDVSLRKGSSAAGQRPFQELAQIASRRIGDTYPESGTAGRMMTSGLLGGGVVADPLTTAAIAAGLWGGGKALYSPQAQQLLRQAVTQRPALAQPVAESVAKTLPFMAPAFIQ